MTLPELPGAWGGIVWEEEGVGKISALLGGWGWLPEGFGVPSIPVSFGMLKAVWRSVPFFLLWLNTRNTKFTLFKCSIQWHQVYAHGCVTISATHLQNFFLLPN